MYDTLLASVDFILLDDDPSLIDDSLRLFGEDSSQSITGNTLGDDLLSFTGSGLGDDSDLISMTYGPYTELTYYSGSIASMNTEPDEFGEIFKTYPTFYSAYWPGDDAPFEDLVFAITVRSRLNTNVSVTLYPNWMFAYPMDIDEDAPVVSRIEGEGCTTIGKTAINCPTDGKYLGNKARITLWGKKFPNDTRSNVTVLIDGKECKSVQFDVEADEISNLRSVSCEFGAGVSGYSTEGYSYVQLSYVLILPDYFLEKSSVPVRYFNYSFPNITRISGCSSGSHERETMNCSRTGGGNNRIKVEGTNFGSSGARVFIGGKQCIKTQHAATNLHGILYCTWPDGTRENEVLWVMNNRGGTTLAIWAGDMSYYQCPTGQMQNGVNCVPCLAGSYSITSNADNCLECDAGKFAIANGSTSCTACPRGYASPYRGAKECNLCGAGTYASTTGSTLCSKCGEGSFSSLSGQAECVTCSDNSHPNPEQTRCLCDIGYYAHGNDSIESVSGNSTLTMHRVLCTECTEGMKCDHPGLIWTVVNQNPLAGYMPKIHTRPESIEMMRCINSACVGGSQKCEDGFTGILCTDCDKGLGKTSGHGCETCLPPGENLLRLMGVVGAVSIMVIFFIRQTIKTAEASKSDMSTIGKIGFSFLQFNSMALQFDYEFPSFVTLFLKAQEQPATVANGVLSVDCFVKDNQTIGIPSIFVKALIYLFIPYIVFLVCRVVFWKYNNMSLTKWDIDNSKVKRKRKNLNILSEMDLPADSKTAKYVHAWNNYITAVIITIFLIHPSIVQQTFSLMNCKQLGARDEDWYLIDFMTEQCWTSRHFVFVFLVAIPMLIFYVLGMPLFVLYRLRKHRLELQKPFKSINRNVVQRYHFLFKGYEAKFYYWEIVIMCRKILMVSIAVFFSYDIQIQALLATLLVVSSLCMHALACPYVSDSMDGLELLSLFGSFCTYFFGQFLFVDTVSEAGKAIVSVIIVLINLAVVGTITFMVAGMASGMVKAFGAKFRRILFCEKNKSEPGSDSDSDSSSDSNSNSSNSESKFEDEGEQIKDKNIGKVEVRNYAYNNVVVEPPEAPKVMNYEPPNKQAFANHNTFAYKSDIFVQKLSPAEGNM